MTHINRMASHLAVLMNGGAWETHYTEAQKQVWRDRVRVIWGLT